MRSRAPETAKAFETEIGNDIADLQEKLSVASEAVGKSEGDKMAQALDQTRDLMRSLETLEHRMAQESDPSGSEEHDGGQTSGQGGQQAEAGRADGRSGEGDTVGDSFTADGAGDRRPDVFDPQDVRQWRSEFQERLGEAQDIRRILEGEQFSAEAVSYTHLTLPTKA